MKDITFLVEELNKLPKGYISKKKINGREYNYLQSIQNGQIKSTYVREKDLDFVYEGISKRKVLEQELNQIINAGKNAPAISSRARELTGSVMMGDIEVARFEKGELLWLDQERAPLQILRTSSLAGFLASRAVDSSRTNSRLLKKIMDIHGEPDEIVALHAHGATISDNYWFKTKGSKLKYEDITFDNDSYSDIALNGQVLVYAKKSKLTPQLTLGGSYEKCWKLIDGKWWLYKRGNPEEIFSECLCAKLATKLGIPSVNYENVDGVVRTRNFAEEFNFEPMQALVGDDDSYSAVFEALDRIDEKMAKDYLRLIWFDSIVNNVDRHNENCGIMRDKKSGAIISLAPNFDNNLALIARTKVLNMEPSKDGLIKYLIKFIKSNPRVRTYYGEMQLPEITKEDIICCFDEIRLEEIKHKKIKTDSTQYNENQIAEYIIGRAEYVNNKLLKV